jgi:hypothetical protein
VFREVNEQIAKRTGLLAETGYHLFICECSDPGCSESLEVTPAEYEAVRLEGTRFLVVPGHQQTRIERVVGDNGRFLVVEKQGPAGEIAAGDPRRP